MKQPKTYEIICWIIYLWMNFANIGRSQVNAYSAITLTALMSTIIWWIICIFKISFAAGDDDVSNSKFSFEPIRCVQWLPTKNGWVKLS